MQGLMLTTPLLVSSILEHAAAVYGDQQIVTRTVEGPLHRTTYAQVHRRAKQLANALRGLGVGIGDRVATIAWNSHRHFEVYYGASGSGAVIHTINPRLQPEQIAYMLEHAEDKVVFVDTTFVPVLCRALEHVDRPLVVCVMCPADAMPDEAPQGAICYETMLEERDATFRWPQLDENAAAAICYTSGTTGNPRGVVYSHRSTVLHAFAVSTPAGLPVAEDDVMLPIVPMFHVNAWGFPYAVPMNGGRLVMPGPRLDGPSLYALMRDEKVTMSAGVPTVWQRVLTEMEAHGPLPALQRVVVGGSAAPASMIEAFQERYGVAVIHAWGMTETSPLGSTCRLRPDQRDAPKAQRLAVQTKQGRPVFGVQMRIVDDEGKVLPHDGKAFGELQVRGPWVRSAYLHLDAKPLPGGWFATGDVATIDEHGYMQITDRKKDLIKSGGEWISSIDLENLAMGDPRIAQAAVVAMPHPEWTERPAMFVVAAAGASVDADAVLEYLRDKVPKWWLPDRVEIVDELPIGATGKVLKTRLRERLSS